MTDKLIYYISFLSNHRLLPESQIKDDNMSSIIKAESEKKNNNFLKALPKVIKESKDNR